MKKILVFAFTTAFLFSCWTKQEVIEKLKTWTGENLLETSTGEVSETPGIEEQRDGDQADSPVKQSETDRATPETPTETQIKTKGETEAQSDAEKQDIEDFNIEFEDIFKLIESDNAQ